MCYDMVVGVYGVGCVLWLNGKVALALVDVCHKAERA